MATDHNLGPKSPGLVILEHELTPQSVAAFISAYPLIKGNGWSLQSLTQLYGGRSYQNAQGSSSNDVVPAGVLVAQNITTSSSTLSTSQTSAFISHLFFGN
jgi:chitin deacetylase